MKSANTMRSLAVAAALLCASASSHAALIFGGPTAGSGSGFGNVNTILTLNNDKDATSTGAVARLDDDDVTSGAVFPGAVHNATYSFEQLNITEASQIRLIFNADEPGGDKNSINLVALTLSIYSEEGGAALFSTSIDEETFLNTTEHGVGSLGYLFLLDAFSNAAAQQFISATNRIGLSSSLSLAEAGPDTFLVAAASPQGPGNSIPEPGSLLLLSLGLAGMTAGGLRKRAQR